MNVLRHTLVCMGIVQPGVLDMQSENDLVRDAVDLTGNALGWDDLVTVLVPGTKDHSSRALRVAQPQHSYQHTSGIGFPTILTSRTKSSPSITVLLRSGFTNSGGSPGFCSAAVDLPEAKITDSMKAPVVLAAPPMRLTFHIQRAFRSVSTMNILSQARVGACVFGFSFFDDQIALSIVSDNDLNALTDFQFNVVFQPVRRQRFAL